MELVHFYFSSGFHVGTWEFVCVLELENTSGSRTLDIWVERLKIRYVEGHCNICCNYLILLIKKSVILLLSLVLVGELMHLLCLTTYIWLWYWMNNHRLHTNLQKDLSSFSLSRKFTMSFTFYFDTWDFKYTSIN